VDRKLKILHQQGPLKHSRREIARMLLAAAPAIALPAHPIWQHLANHEILDAADAQLDSAHWKPLFLTAQQERCLQDLAEVIVPGSTRAHVSRFIDLLLSVDSPIAQHKFLGALATFDEAATKQYRKAFAQLDRRQSEALVTLFANAPRSGEPGSGLHGHFEELKEWISGAYYSSEIGMRELGWNPDRVFAVFPVCSHPDGHV
jgi:hypothetical protein